MIITEALCLVKICLFLNLSTCGWQKEPALYAAAPTPDWSGTLLSERPKAKAVATESWLPKTFCPF